MASPGTPTPNQPFDIHKLFKPTPPLPTPTPYSYYHHPTPPPHPPQDTHFANFHHQITPLIQPPPLPPHLPNNNNNNNNPQNPNPGATLMALLRTPPRPAIPMSSGVSDFSVTQGQNGNITSQLRMPSNKFPKGRCLYGNRVVYDIDVRLPGEVQPQLEFTPITKYGSDPGLFLGRQIAVNKTYICYGLKLGAIRVLNINAALRSLLKGLAQKVTDMVFFAEDVHLLASASVDGRIYVWNITEGPDEENKPQITGKIVIAIQISGEGESVHPRVCWHCYKQEVLVVGIGKLVLRIDTTKVGKGEVFSAEAPLKCPVDNMIDGVQLVGNHDGEVTDLSMCQWMTTRLVSASVDGTIKIWEDSKMLPIAVLRPHDGQPVNSVTFLTAPHRPDHIILLTGGPLNREVKIWASASEEGWLIRSDAESWLCTQALELKSSSEARVGVAFFNQVVALSQAGLLLLANAKKNAIYAIHVEYGPNPASTHMDYIAEFTVTMPILSFTRTSGLLPNGEQIVEVYCVQTHAIQQYDLELSQCMPPPLENVVMEKSEFSVSQNVPNTEGFTTMEPSGAKPTEIPFDCSAPQPALHVSNSESALTLKHPVISASLEMATSQELTNSNMESKSISLPVVINGTDIACVASRLLPLSPRLSKKLDDFRSSSNSFEPGSPLNVRGEDQKVIEYSVDREMDILHANLSDIPSLNSDSRNDENKVAKDDISSVLNHPINFKHPTHLVTPSEILMSNSSSEMNHVVEDKNEGEPHTQDVGINNNLRNVKVVGETRFGQNELGSQGELHSLVSENNEKLFCSQASDLGIELARECCAIPAETYVVEESRELDGASRSEEMDQFLSAEDDVHDSATNVSGKVIDSAMPSTVQPSPAPTTKRKKRKGKKNAQGSGPSSASPSGFNSTDSSNEASVSSGIPSVEAAFAQIVSIQESLNQLTSMQKEMQKQMAMMVATPVTKEGRRLEVALGQIMEKAVSANSDVLWARFREDIAKQEKLVWDHTQQSTNLITNCLNKDLPAMLEKTVKKELAAVGPAVERMVTPTIEKTVSTAIADAFQRGVGDKALNHLEKSVNTKLETTVVRQIQAQFQTSGKQVLQEALKSSLEASVIPAFEMSCKALFEQVDATFQKGMVEQTTAAQQQFDSTHVPLAIALRDAISSASSVTQTLSSELADGQRKLLALAVAEANSKATNPLVSQLSNNGTLAGLPEQIEAPWDPTKELSRLISERKYDEAFTAALQRTDVSIVSWLCSQVDLQMIFSMNPLPLSQGVLLSLLQRLACDISQDTPRKLSWMRDTVTAMNPTDPMIAMHVRPIFEQVYQILNHRLPTTTTGGEVSNIRIVMHIINSMLMTCK